MPALPCSTGDTVWNLNGQVEKKVAERNILLIWMKIWWDHLMIQNYWKAHWITTKNGTWAYLGSGKNENRRYLFWTSVNVSNFPTGTKIPVIICRADNEYYVSESTTAERTGDKITTLYKVIADHQYNAESYQKIADKGTKYDSLQAAYDAYVEKITEDSNYSQFKDTLSKNWEYEIFSVK